MRVRWSLLVVTVVAAFLGVLPARAEVPTTWSDPVDLDAPIEVGGPVAVGVDATGDMLAIWLASTGAAEVVFRSATRPASGTWTAPVDRSERVEISDAVSLAEDESGRAVLAWSQWNGAHFTVHAAAIEADGTWGDTVEVSSLDESASFVQATIDETGHAVLAWNAAAAGVRTATYTFGSGWSPVDTLTTDSEATAVTVSSNPAGDVTAVWWLQYTHRLFAASRPAGGSWTSPEPISAAGVETSVSGVAQGPGASARAVWTEQRGTGWEVVTADRSSAGIWGPGTDLAPGSSDAGVTVRTDVAGNSVVVLLGVLPGTGNAVFASDRTKEGAWTPIEQLSPVGSDARYSNLATTPGGNALLVMDLVGPNGVVATWARTRSADASWSPVSRLSETSESTSGSLAALDDSGNAVVAWSIYGTIPPKTQAITSPAPVAPVAPPPPVVLVPRFTG